MQDSQTLKHLKFDKNGPLEQRLFNPGPGHLVLVRYNPTEILEEQAHSWACDKYRSNGIKILTIVTGMKRLKLIEMRALAIANKITTVCVLPMIIENDKPTHFDAEADIVIHLTKEGFTISKLRCSKTMYSDVQFPL